VIQCGAVLAVLPLFRERLHQFIFRLGEAATRDYLLKILVAFGITGVGGLIMEKKHFKLPEALLPVAVALFVGGVLFVLVERRLRGRQLSKEVTWLIVIAVGVGQLIAAAFPGTSRSGATILLALLLGLDRVAATEFTFLVGIPTMLSAGGLKIFKAVHHSADASLENWNMVLLGAIVAAIVSFISVKWLLRFVQSHTFVGFGWYRIALAIFVGVLLLGESKSQPRSPEKQARLNTPDPVQLCAYGFGAGMNSFCPARSFSGFSPALALMIWSRETLMPFSRYASTMTERVSPF
jgi:undecaprenyl-diphosphatase